MYLTGQRVSNSDSFHHATNVMDKCAGCYTIRQHNAPNTMRPSSRSFSSANSSSHATPRTPLFFLLPAFPPLSALGHMHFVLEQAAHFSAVVWSSGRRVRSVHSDEQCSLILHSAPSIQQPRQAIIRQLHSSTSLKLHGVLCFFALWTKQHHWPGCQLRQVAQHLVFSLESCEDNCDP